MRLLHVVPAVSEEASGPSYSVVRLCEALIAEGHEVRLDVLAWASMEKPPAFARFHPLGAGPRRLGRSPEMDRWLREVSRARRVDLIHNHSLWMMPNVYAGRAARATGVPLLVSPRGTLSEWAFVRGSALKRIFWPLVQRRAVEAAACLHATALSELADIRRHGFRQPVAVIGNGVDVPDLPPRSGGEQRTLLFLGRIHPKKGLDLLLPAWGTVQRRFPDWRLRVVGPDDGAYAAELRRTAHRLRLERVEFSGALGGRDKWLAYRDADLFVLPTYSENFGMAVAESLAAGTPALVSRGAPWEGLVTRRAGWWVDIGLDPLAATLEEALAAPRPLLEAMGQRGREWMREEYSWESIGKRMGETYRWVLGRAPRPPWVVED